MIFLGCEAGKTLNPAGEIDDSISAREMIQKVGFEFTSEITAEHRCGCDLRETGKHSVFLLGKFAVSGGEEQIVSAQTYEQDHPQDNAHFGKYFF